MNQATLKGQWLQIKGQVRKQWGKLTDDEIDQVQGDAEILLRKMSSRMRQSASENTEQPS
jgi:uncharacterized protein YjbJ (UPF0337 family)